MLLKQIAAKAITMIALGLDSSARYLGKTNNLRVNVIAQRFTLAI